MEERDPPFVMERYGRLSEMDRSFDIAYWQRLGPAAIFEAAWQMVRRTGRWRVIFERLSGRIGRKKAIVAIARRLLGVMMALLKSGQPYRHAYEPAAAPG